jgi:hypothetical protein
MLKLKLTHLLCAMAISLPLWGFSIINIANRGIRIDWVIAALTVGVFYFNFCCYSDKKSLIRDSILFWLIILNLSVLLSLYIPLSAKNSTRIEDYLTTWIQFALGSVFFMTVCNFKVDIDQMRKIFKVYIVVAVIVASFGVVQLIGSYWGYGLKLEFTNVGRPDPHSGYEAITGAFRRPTSFFSEPRQFGNFLVPIWAISIVLLLTKLPVFTKRVSYLFSIIICLGIGSSLALSGYITLFASTFILGIYFFRRGMIKLSSFFVIVLFTLFVISMALRESEISIIQIILHRFHTLDRIRFIHEQFGTMTSTTSGLFLYVSNIKFAYETWMQSPLIGVGLNNLEYYSKYGLSGAHAPFRFLAETGLLGIISFTGFIISLLRKNIKLLRSPYLSEKDKQLVLIGIFLLLTTIIASLGSIYSYYSTFFWFNLSLVGLIYFNLRMKATLMWQRDILGSS